MLKLDLHIHSCYSPDSLSPIEDILKLSLKLGLNIISITDHNIINGSLKAAKLARKLHRIKVVPGVEISTDKGDIICLGIEDMPVSKYWLDVVDYVREHDGILILPHPYRGHRGVEEIARKVDIIEAYNGRTKPECNIKALKLALKLKKPYIAASDAHAIVELGRTYTILVSDDFKDVLNFEVKRKIRYRYTNPAFRVTYSVIAYALHPFKKILNLVDE